MIHRFYSVAHRVFSSVLILSLLFQPAQPLLAKLIPVSPAAPVSKTAPQPVRLPLSAWDAVPSAGKLGAFHGPQPNRQVQASSPLPPLIGQIAFLAYQNNASTGPESVAVINSDGTNLTTLGNDPDRNPSPLWSPTGQKVVWTRHLGTLVQVVVANTDGTQPPIRVLVPGLDLLGNQCASLGLFDGIHLADRPSWSPDGSQLATYASMSCEDDLERTVTQFSALVLINADGSNERLFLDSQMPFSVGRTPSWSPDGHEIA